MTLKERKKVSPIIRMNIGIAVNLPVRIRSIFSLLIFSRLTRGFVTVASQRSRMKEKRMSATAAFLSSPLSRSS